jgi:hypothetical protein
MLLEAIVEHVWVEEDEGPGAATPASWHEGAECHSA